MCFTPLGNRKNRQENRRICAEVLKKRTYPQQNVQQPPVGWKQKKFFVHQLQQQLGTLEGSWNQQCCWGEITDVPAAVRKPPETSLWNCLAKLIKWLFLNCCPPALLRIFKEEKILLVKQKKVETAACLPWRDINISNKGVTFPWFTLLCRGSGFLWRSLSGKQKMWWWWCE